MGMGRRVRVATVQLEPARVGDAAANMAAVRALLPAPPPPHAARIDLLVLPEMITTGYYRFQHAREVHPLCEDALEQGASSTFALAAQLAREYSAYVVVGLAERTSSTAASFTQSGSAYVVSPPHDARQQDLVEAPGDQSSEPSVRFYNSAALFDRSGRLVHVFRKHFLYDDDKIWAQEGPGFQYVDLPDIGRVSVGICMDLNPYEFEAPFDAFELASFCAHNEVDILALPTAWLLSPPTDDTKEQDDGQRATSDASDRAEDAPPSMETIQYWALRCRPLYAPESSSVGVATAGGSTTSSRKRAFLVAANRTGTERGATFAGSSAVLQFEPADGGQARAAATSKEAARGPITLLAALGTRTQGAQVVEIEIDTAPDSRTGLLPFASV